MKTKELELEIILTLKINVALLRIQTFKGLHVHWVVDVDSTSYAS